MCEILATLSLVSTILVLILSARCDKCFWSKYYKFGDKKERECK